MEWMDAGLYGSDDWAFWWVVAALRFAGCARAARRPHIDRDCRDRSKTYGVFLTLPCPCSCPKGRATSGSEEPMQRAWLAISNGRTFIIWRWIFRSPPTEQASGIIEALPRGRGQGTEAEYGTRLGAYSVSE